MNTSHASRADLLAALAHTVRLRVGVGDILGEATRVLGEHFGAGRVLFVDVLDGTVAVVRAEHRLDGMPTLVGRHQLADFGPGQADALAAGRTVSRSDPEPAGDGRPAGLDAGVSARVSVPLVKDHQLVAFLSVQAATPRGWTPEEVELIEQAAQWAWAAVEQARTERRLQASEARYRALFELLDDGFCIIERVEGGPGDPLDFRYVEANGAFSAQSGVDGVVGKTIRQAFPGESEEWFDTYDMVLRTGTPATFERALETQGRVLELYAFRIDDEPVSRVAVRFKDITERVRANRELAELRGSHSRWRTAMFNSLQEGYFVCDPAGALLEVNDAFTALLGYDQVGLPYPPPHPWWPDAGTDPEGRAAVEQAWADALRQQTGRYTLPMYHRDGHRVWVAVTLNAVPERAGQSMLVGTVRDVTTARLRAERDAALTGLTARLARASSAEDVFRGGLAELRAHWSATRVVAVHGNPAASGPVLTSTSPRDTWQDLPHTARRTITDLRHQPPGKVTVTTRAGTQAVTGAGVNIGDEHEPTVVWLDIDPIHRFTSEDMSLLSVLGGYLAQAAGRARGTDRQADVAITLQRAILSPHDLPDGFAVRYQPAVRPLEVGGDWYDVVAIADGRVGLVVGDCVGRGLPAAAVMGQLRSACRALLLQARTPVEVITALDEFARLIPAAKCTTVLCAIVDQAIGSLRYSAAGHPPPILAHTDGTAELLDQARSTPVACIPTAHRAEATVTLRPGSTLLLYTDGLIERRSRLLDAGIAHATELLIRHRQTGIEQLADELLRYQDGSDDASDDTALLLYRHAAARRAA